MQLFAATCCSGAASNNEPLRFDKEAYLCSFFGVTEVYLYVVSSNSFMDGCFLDILFIFLKTEILQSQWKLDDVCGFLQLLF